MGFDTGNPRANEADIFVAGKTTEEVVRAYVKAQEDLGLTPHPWMVALRDRFDRKAARRAVAA